MNQLVVTRTDAYEITFFLRHGGLFRNYSGRSASGKKNVVKKLPNM